MNFTQYLHPTSDLKGSRDSLVPAAPTMQNPATCCPDDFCFDPCAMSCAYLDLLPNGPLWDKQKIEARESMEAAECDFSRLEEPECPSMARYALYLSFIQLYMVQNILWPSIRESSPFTAVTSVDSWLEQLGWQDCFRSACRPTFTAEFSPYDCESGCGYPEYNAPSFPEEFECALKVATLRAVARLSKGIIKNLAGINWVLEPLNMVLRPRQPYSEEIQAYLDSGCDGSDGQPCWSCEVSLEICQTSETLPGCPNGDVCEGLPPPVSAAQSYQCLDGPEITLYPAAFVAECLVRAIISSKCPNIIYHC